MRNLVVLLSIAAVLACPYECAVKLAAAQAIGSDAKPACCEECQAHRPATPTGDPTPNAPTPDEDGRWCLCEGAVFDAGARSPVDDSVQVTLWTGDAGLAEYSAVSAPATGFERFALPPTMAGWPMRIAICSLLL